MFDQKPHLFPSTLHYQKKLKTRRIKAQATFLYTIYTITTDEQILLKTQWKKKHHDDYFDTHLHYKYKTNQPITNHLLPCVTINVKSQINHRYIFIIILMRYKIPWAMIVPILFIKIQDYFSLRFCIIVEIKIASTQYNPIIIQKFHQTPCWLYIKKKIQTTLKQYTSVKNHSTSCSNLIFSPPDYMNFNKPLLSHYKVKPQTSSWSAYRWTVTRSLNLLKQQPIFFAWFSLYPCVLAPNKPKTKTTWRHKKITVNPSSLKNFLKLIKKDARNNDTKVHYTDVIFIFR